MIPSNTPLFEKVYKQVNIAEVITRYIELTPTKDAQFLIGPCPFCPKIKGNLLVNTEVKRYFCFHCSSTGNVIDFISKIGSMNKLTAARFLARTNGIDINTTNPTPVSGEENANNETVGQSMEVHKG